MAFARAKIGERREGPRVTSSFRNTARNFDYQNPLKSPSALDGKLSRKATQLAQPATWESLLSRTTSQERPQSQSQASIYRRNEKNSARTLCPDLQEPARPKMPLTRSRLASDSNIMGLMLKSSEGKNITECQRKHNSKQFEHTIQLAHDENRPKLQKPLGLNYFSASEVFPVDSPTIGAGNSVQIKDSTRVAGSKR